MGKYKIPYQIYPSECHNFQIVLTSSLLNDVCFTGGTIDITVHEVQSDGHLKELYNANGGPWGGAFVDKVSLI